MDAEKLDADYGKCWSGEGSRCFFAFRLVSTLDFLDKFEAAVKKGCIAILFSGQSTEARHTRNSGKYEWSICFVRPPMHCD